MSAPLELSSRWRCAHIGREDDTATIGGLKIWEHEWRRLRGSIRLPHPTYPAQILRFRLYEIGRKTRAVSFAAAEVSPGIWGFYVWDDSARR